MYTSFRFFETEDIYMGIYFYKNVQNQRDHLHYINRISALGAVSIINQKTTNNEVRTLDIVSSEPVHKTIMRYLLSCTSVSG